MITYIDWYFILHWWCFFWLMFCIGAFICAVVVLALTLQDKNEQIKHLERDNLITNKSLKYYSDKIEQVKKILFSSVKM